eukprot:GHVS01088939.1.p1 GENE.GHVS01088939.1~~GHVS01088939.1.p1  ORF type:complete len:692 (+),score=90.54 GHVS01088939.1:138-2213(+)
MTRHQDSSHEAHLVGGTYPRNSSVLPSVLLHSARCSYRRGFPLLVALALLSCCSAAASVLTQLPDNSRRLNPACPDKTWVPSASHDRCFKVLEFEDRLAQTATTTGGPEEVGKPSRFPLGGDSRRNSMNSWVEGMRMCVEQGAVLATLHSEQEDRVAHMLSDHIQGSCWIGLRRYLLKRPERGWIWIDKSSSLKDDEYMSWSGKMKNAWKLIPPEDKCGEIDNDGWGESPCWGKHSKLRCAVCATLPLSSLQDLPHQSYLSAFNPSSLWRSPSSGGEVPPVKITPLVSPTADHSPGFWTSVPEPSLVMEPGSDLYWVEPERDSQDAFVDALAGQPPTPQQTRVDAFFPAEKKRLSSSSLVHILSAGDTLDVVSEQSDMKSVKQATSYIPPASSLGLVVAPPLAEHSDTENLRTVPPPPVSHAAPAMSSEESIEQATVPLVSHNEDNEAAAPRIRMNLPTNATRISMNSLRGGSGSHEIDASLIDPGSRAGEYLWEWVSASPYDEKVPPELTGMTGLSPPARLSPALTRMTGLEETATGLEVTATGLSPAVRPVQMEKQQIAIGVIGGVEGLTDSRERDYSVSRAELQHVAQFRHWLPVVIASALTLLGLLLCCAVLGLCCYRRACCCCGGTVHSKQGPATGPRLQTDSSEPPTTVGDRDESEADEEEESEHAGTSNETGGGDAPFLLHTGI